MRQLLSLSTLGLVAGLVSAAAPAMAGSVFIPVPEPSSMALLAGAAGAALAYRFIRRK